MILGVGVVPELPVLALMFNALGVAVMCGFIYSRTGSGPVVLLLQIMLNSSALVLPIVPTNGGIPTYWAFALTYLSASLLLFLFFGPRPLFRQLALRPL